MEKIVRAWRNRQIKNEVRRAQAIIDAVRGGKYRPCRTRALLVILCEVVVLLTVFACVAYVILLASWKGHFHLLS